jgi:uncharacterized protein (DUF2062 family)
MFQRRKKRHMGHRFLRFLWPKAGWRRTSIYMAHRIKRIPDTPYSIAAGFACGAATSFTPFLGFHFVLAALAAWIIRANIMASVIGTAAVGNPWTLPFICAGIYNLGNWMLGRKASAGSLSELSMISIFDNIWEIFMPMMIAGFPVALVVWVFFFFPLRSTVAGYQARRRYKIEKTRQDPGL